MYYSSRPDLDPTFEREKTADPADATHAKKSADPDSRHKDSWSYFPFK